MSIHETLQRIEGQVTATQVTVGKLEERIPTDLTDRMARVEEAAHTKPCNQLLTHLAAHDKKAEQQEARWARMKIGIVVALVGSGLGGSFWAAVELVKWANGGG